MTTAPALSIVTPTLNSAGVIETCLRSIAGQTLTPEHLLVDGHSTDGTLERVHSLGSQTIILEEPPSGIYAALNAGIQASSGEIVGILHSDDVFASPDVLALVAQAFQDQAVDACYGDLCYVSASDPTRIVRYWQAGRYGRGQLFNGWMPPHPTFFVRRSVYERFGLYRTDLGTAADYEMMVRLLVKHEIQVAYIPEVLVHMRSGGASNASLAARIEANRMDRKAWRVNGLKPYPWTTIAKPLRKMGQWWRRPSV